MSFNTLAKALLQDPDTHWDRREAEFLDHMAYDPPRQLSLRQAEWLKNLAEKAQRFKTIGDISTWSLIRQAYEQRLELSNANRLWIVDQWEERRTSLSKAGLERLRDIAVELRLIGDDRS